MFLKNSSDKRRVILSEVSEKDKKYDPIYLNYVKILRSKIEEQIYKNYTNYQVGDIFVEFSISSNGSLENVRIINDKSADISSLKEICLKSIKDAAPYPPFPAGLKQKQVTFTQQINFKLNY